MISWWWECQVQWNSFWDLWLRLWFHFWKWQKTSPPWLLLHFRSPWITGRPWEGPFLSAITASSIRDADSYNGHQFNMHRASWRTVLRFIVMPKQWPYSTLKLTFWHSKRLTAITQKPHKQKWIQSIGNWSTSHLEWVVSSGPGEGPEAERLRYHTGAMVGGCQLLSLYPWPWGHSEARMGWGSHGLCHTYSCIVWCARDFML